MLCLYVDSNVQRKVSKLGYDITPLTQAQRDELAGKVDANTRHIALESGTERAFTGRTVNGVLSVVLNLLHSSFRRERGTVLQTVAQPLVLHIQYDRNSSAYAQLPLAPSAMGCNEGV